MTTHGVKALQQELEPYWDPEYRYSLPPAFYTDAGWLDFEIETLLKREWLCLGRVDEVRNPGDYFTIDVLGEPILVVRGDDGRLRVLANICRHRNMPVAEGRGNCKRFVCPYHAWSYRNDGQLLRAPYLEQQVDPADCALPELKSEVWQGFLFMNPDGQAAPLAPRLSGLDDILKNFHGEEMRHVFVTEETWEANWKCLLENFMEGYHLSRVHPQTLGGRTPTQLCEKLPGGETYTGYRAHYPEGAPLRGKCHADLTDLEKSCSTLFSVFPAMVASQASDVLVYLLLQPEGADRVRIRWGMALYDSDMPAAEIRSRIELWQAINAEDRNKLARLQTALHSRHAVSGPLAPDDFEGTLRDFYGFLVKRLGPRQKPGTSPAKE